MPAARLNLEVAPNAAWRGRLRYKLPAPTRQDPNRRLPVDLTGWHAFLEARDGRDGPSLFTLSTRAADDPTAPIEPLGADGVIAWALNLAALGITVKTAVYELLLIDPDGMPEPLLEGQLEFEPGVAVLPT